MRKKITVVGAGNVGATCAHRLADKALGDVVLTDIIEGVPQGKALDLLQAGPVEGYDVLVTGANNYEPTAHSDIVVITAGFPRKPDMSRDDLVLKNYEVVKQAVEQVVKYSPECILIVVTNPLDAMCHVAYETCRIFQEPGDRHGRHPGFGALPHIHCPGTERFRGEHVHAFVLGGHGDTMVPLARFSTVAGIPITELLDQATIDRLIQRTRDGGAEIVKLLRAGSAYYAPSASVVEMVEAILLDRRRRSCPVPRTWRGSTASATCSLACPANWAAAVWSKSWRSS